MKRIAHIIGVIWFGCVVASPAGADPVVIRFDAPPCAAIQADIYPGDCYAGFGVLLSASGNRGAVPVIRLAASPRAISPPNIASGYFAWDDVPSLGDVRVDFIAPSGEMGFTDYVAWHVSGSRPGTDGDPWGVQIFGVAGILEEIRFAWGDVPVAFSRPQRDIIAAAWYSGSGTVPFGIDNLTFNAPQATPAPEPSTLILLSAGAVALLRRRSWVRR